MDEIIPVILFQHSAARRRLYGGPKETAGIMGFNTQPPEGGCLFTTGGLDKYHVSTLSRPKAAGESSASVPSILVSTLSRPKAADHRHATAAEGITVSTLSRPKAAAKTAGTPTG